MITKIRVIPLSLNSEIQIIKPQKINFFCFRCNEIKMSNSISKSENSIFANMNKEKIFPVLLMHTEILVNQKIGGPQSQFCKSLF